MISPNVKFPTVIGEKTWTWKAYRASLNKFTSQLKFGVGYVMDVRTKILEILIFHFFYRRRKACHPVPKGVEDRTSQV